jgi:hypothetical protein
MRGNGWLCFLMVLPCMAAACVAQGAKGSGTGVVGVVMDPTCASLPRARILLVNTRSFQTQTSEAAGDGAFAFPSLPPGDYAVIVAGSSDPHDVCWRPEVREIKVEEGKPASILVVLRLDDKRCKGVVN